MGTKSGITPFVQFLIDTMVDVRAYNELKHSCFWRPHFIAFALFDLLYDIS